MACRGQHDHARRLSFRESGMRPFVRHYSRSSMIRPRPVGQSDHVLFGILATGRAGLAINGIFSYASASYLDPTNPQRLDDYFTVDTGNRHSFRPRKRY